jgi:AcrR family transcriptional regulator
MDGGLRERNRRAALREINMAAMRLFLDQGFTQTTTEQIALAAGMSQRSLFRLVQTKEDLVLGDLLETGHTVLAALQARPASESPWDAMQNALHVIAETPTYNPEDGLKLTQMMLNTPSLRARAVEKRLDWLDLLAPELDRRMGGGSPLQARAIVACALTCLDTAAEIWVARNGAGDPRSILDEVIDAVRASLQSPDTQGRRAPRMHE